jgi:hypothetical protein
VQDTGNRADARPRAGEEPSAAPLNSRAVYPFDLQPPQARFPPGAVTALNNLDSGPSSLPERFAATGIREATTSAHGLAGQRVALTGGEFAFADEEDAEDLEADPLALGGAGVRFSDVVRGIATAGLVGFTLDRLAPEGGRIDPDGSLVVFFLGLRLLVFFIRW